MPPPITARSNFMRAFLFANHNKNYFIGLGGKETITYAPFPSADPSYLVDETVLYVVQVNGKVRGKWMLPKDKTQEELLAFIQTQPNIAKHLTGDISKVIYVPNKLISLVCND